MSKSSAGNFFEDFQLGARMRHATPRTIHGGDLSMYIGATGDRRPLNSSTTYAKSLGFKRELVHELLVFHVVFGKSVGDISRNAVANLGYADVHFLRSVYPGDTLSAESEVIGLRETSKGDSGIVYVRTRGIDQLDREVLHFTRWVLVKKRDAGVKSKVNEVPEFASEIAAGDLCVPSELNLDRFDDLQWATGARAHYDDYAVGEVIHHLDGMTIEESDHMTLTRMVQNTATVHFNQHSMSGSRFGKRLIYGGHIISVAHALSFNGLENVIAMAGWNSGTHAAPTFAGDTIYASTEVLAKAPLGDETTRLGALRLRLVAYKNVDPSKDSVTIRDGDGKYDSSVVLDLDYWGLIPRRA